MAYRPQWYETERGFGGRWGNLRNWSGVRLVLTLTIAAFVLQFLASVVALGPRGFALALDPIAQVAALRAWWPTEGGRFFNFAFPLQLFSYLLVHGGVWHLLWNMLFVWWFGVELEANLGRSAFLRLYLTAGVVGGLCQWVAGVASGSSVPTVGASGAVYAVMVLYALQWPRRTIFVFPIPIPIPVIVIMVVRVVEDLLGLFSGASTTAHLVHLGGAAIGVLWFRRGDVLVRWRVRRQRQRAARTLASEAEGRREMDRILARIQASGLASLSSEERAFLDRRSRELRRQEH